MHCVLRQPPWCLHSAWSHTTMRQSLPSHSSTAPPLLSCQCAACSNMTAMVRRRSERSQPGAVPVGSVQVHLQDGRAQINQHSRPPAAWVISPAAQTAPLISTAPHSVWAVQGAHLPCSALSLRCRGRACKCHPASRPVSAYPAMPDVLLVLPPVLALRAGSEQDVLTRLCLTCRRCPSMLAPGPKRM